MRRLMRSLVVLVVLMAAGCGSQIGDSCIVNTDCALDGTRTCDITQTDGYCTIIGCDYDTCPGEAACIRFFQGGFSNRPCNPVTENITTDDCSVDELCTLEGECVPRSSESRFCMKKCSQTSDCRGGYECRDLTLMISHGGEPVLAPGVAVDDSAPHFCAMAPVAN
jgi:hypothetical protein